MAFSRPEGLFQRNAPDTVHDPTGQETPERRDNLVEEIGDSLICIHQLMEIYGIKNWEIQKVVKQKLERQEARMHGDV